MNKALLLALAAMVTSGCGVGGGGDTRYNMGFDDGHAVGYNTTCKIRATLIEGDWEDKEYSRGYNDGYAEGASECLADLEDGN